MTVCKALREGSFGGLWRRCLCSKDANRTARKSCTILSTPSVFSVASGVSLKWFIVESSSVKNKKSQRSLDALASGCPVSRCLLTNKLSKFNFYLKRNLKL